MIKKRIGILGVIVMLGCSPPPVSVSGEKPPPLVETALMQVKGLTVELNDTPAVLLTWHEVAGATGYNIYRHDTALGASPVQTAARWASRFVGSAAQNGQVIKTVTTLAFTDSQIEPGTQYIYRVAATDATREGPLSDPAAVDVPQPELLRVKAPAVPSYYSQGNPDPFQNAPGTAGGNSGLATVTTFPGTAGIASCGSTGAAFSNLRPAERTLLPEGEQTFSVTAVYNTAGTLPFRFVVGAIGTNSADLFDSGPLPEAIYYQESLLPLGCGVTTVTFTIDTAVLRNEGIALVYWITDDTSIDVMEWKIYWRSRKGWISIDSTQPAQNTVLNGSTIQINASYSGLPTGVAEFTLSADDMLNYGVLADAVTTVSGSGSFSFNLDHRLTCGVDRLRLTLGMNTQERSYADSVTFTSDAGGSVLVLPVQTTFWATSADGFGTSIAIEACDFVQRPYTATTEAGLLLDAFGAQSYESGTTVHGLTGDHFEVYADNQTWGNWGYGKFVSNVTFSFGGVAAPITIPIEINTFDIFYVESPPATAVGLQEYSVSITGVNMPDGFLSIGSYRWEYDYAVLWGSSSMVSTASETFAGTVTYGTCGYYSSAVKLARGNQRIDLYSMGRDTYVGSSALHQLVARPADIGFDFADPNALTVQQIELSDLCGQPFQWNIVAADSWMEFGSLTGSSATPVDLHLIESEIPFITDPMWSYAYGEFWVDTDLPGVSLHVGVSAFR